MARRPGPSLKNAVIDGDYDRVDQIIGSVDNINQKYENGNTLLHLAILNAKPQSDEIVKLLLEKGASMAIQNSAGEIPTQTVRRLLNPAGSQEAKVSPLDRGRTPQSERWATTIAPTPLYSSPTASSRAAPDPQRRHTAPSRTIRTSKISQQNLKKRNDAYDNIRDNIEKLYKIYPASELDDLYNKFTVYDGNWNKEILRQENRNLFVFADNKRDYGTMKVGANQARIRGAQNAFGFSTGDFGGFNGRYKDIDFDKNIPKINSDFKKLMGSYRRFIKIYFSKGFLGTGIFKLQYFSPKTFMYLYYLLVPKSPGTFQNQLNMSVVARASFDYSFLFNTMEEYYSAFSGYSLSYEPRNQIFEGITGQKETNPGIFKKIISNYKNYVIGDDSSLSADVNFELERGILFEVLYNYSESKEDFLKRLAEYYGPSSDDLLFSPRLRMR